MNKKYKIRSAIALLIGTALLAPVASTAQSVSMVRLLDQIAKPQLPRYTRRVAPRSGSLEPGGTVELSFRLTKGAKYGFVGVGDDNATDVDVQVVDANGNVVEEDTTENESAVVAYDAEQTTVYDVRVIMAGCSADECRYAVGVYRR